MTEPIIYRYNPTPVDFEAEAAEQQAWLDSLTEGQIVPLVDREGQVVGHATIGKRIPASEPKFEIKFGFDGTEGEA